MGDKELLRSILNHALNLWIAGGDFIYKQFTGDQE